MNNQTCILEHCERHVSSRGLCKQHYDRTRNRIRTGQDTYDELVREGRLLPVGNGASRGIAPTPKCITEGCENRRRRRGVCLSCLSLHKQAMRMGATTDEELVMDRKLLPFGRMPSTDMPSDEERAATIAEIQAEWSDEQREKRDHRRQSAWQVPRCRTFKNARTSIADEGGAE